MATSREMLNSLSPAERFARTLVTLTRRIWKPQCTFEGAMGAICESAAEIMGAERVSIWKFEAAENELRCIHTFDSASHTHGDMDAHESMVIDPLAYISTLQDERSIGGVRQGSLSAVDASSPFPDFIRLHRMHSVLDAPACADGDLKGAICMESSDPGRRWSREERVFAGSMGDFVGIAYEIDRRREAEAEVHHLRLHDAATGLPNREYFVERVRQRLVEHQDRPDSVAVLVVTIDCSIASAGPHSPSADDVTVRIAHELKRLGGFSFEIARIHSSKFAILPAGMTPQGVAIRLAERGLEWIRAIEWEHAENVPKAAVGIAFAPRQGPCDAGELLREAEEAAHRAAVAGSGCYEVFEPSDHDELVARLRMMRALQRGLASGAFQVFYQPEFDTQSKHWVAAEALVRWDDDGRLRSAGEFIEVAEESGLTIALGKWVLHRACADAVQWPKSGAGVELDVRVNVSAHQFDDGQLLRHVGSALLESGLAPNRLCLEITETTLMANIEHAPVVIEALRKLGVKLAIDDFGTGYASLVYLKRFPVDAIKIDRSFVADLPENAVDAAIVSALVGLAGRLNVDVVAEGVETLAQQAALTMLGVRRQQGWLYAKAMTNAELRHQVSARAPEFQLPEFAP